MSIFFRAPPKAKVSSVILFSWYGQRGPANASLMFLKRFKGIQGGASTSLSRGQLMPELRSYPALWPAEMCRKPFYKIGYFLPLCSPLVHPNEFIV